jgi:F-type H+-transporting ATPase subunit b
MTILTQFAESAPSGDIFSALGIDWKMLVFQMIAFVVLVGLLGKFVYPVLMKTVDKRQADIEAGTKAAEEAKQHASKAEADVEKLMKEARREATDIVSTAKKEAAAAVEKAESKSKTRAEQIIADAHAQLEKDVVAAKKVLHNETLDLVALATEKVVGKTVSVKVDENVISAAVKEAK